MSGRHQAHAKLTLEEWRISTIDKHTYTHEIIITIITTVIQKNPQKNQTELWCAHEITLSMARVTVARNNREWPHAY